MKKSLLLTASALIASASVANANQDYNGVYVGVSGAQSQGNSKAQLTNDSGLFQHTGRAGVKGGHGGLHVGIQKQFQRTIVGLETGGHIGKATSSKTTTLGTTPYKQSLNRKHGYHVAAKVGYELNSWVPYVKLGYDNSHFQAKTQKDSYAESSKKRHLDGLLVGFGLETQVQKMLLGAEWVHTIYRGQKFNNITSIDRLRDKHSPNIGDFKVKLSYKV